MTWRKRFCTLIYLYLIVTPKYLCFILLTPHPSSDCKPCHCCLAVIFDWQLWRPITAKPPTLCAAFYPLIGQLFRRAVPQKRHCLLTNHSSLPSRLFPALFAVSVTFFRSLYQRYFQLRFIPVSPQHLYRGYYELISNFFFYVYVPQKQKGAEEPVTLFPSSVTSVNSR